ncbi:Bug family tripartite tricarboxylate transporter substrate binding protein [Pseudoroseomonas ludipueritiae]|uniref:Tripartite tricarboxylate transporter substrate binding protein n=1 Tax=Pseudoroseomonas ludipueritiae TaxID=198093 RepID=A0ABR7R1G8_9PROT|nr:tripartite tricarboxylate transporter substrate binding protein [Pseudoroseomonas ludipueritiae]MBC9175498.1 tripartite tricarboxylate transporter substrate binding protein [Pseudoroseomonas ludipueritiae]
MNRRDLLALGAAATLPGLLPASARAQATWPSQPIRLVVPFAAGGPTDVPARLIADELSKLLPQRVIVENRTGAGVVVGSDAVAKAKDGHTALYTTIAHAALREIFANLPFDPIKDFQPVALTGTIPMLLMVNKDLPVNSLPELVELFKKNPGKYDYASTGNGAALHLASELFLKQAGDLKVNHVPYRGSAAAMPDLLNGTVVMMLDVANSALPFVQRGEVKGLAISSSQRLAQLPEIPTFQEAGVAGYEAYTWHMVMMPAGTPEAIVNQFNAALNKVMAMDSVKARLSDLTMQTVSDSTPASTAKFLNDEIAKWTPIIRAAGIKAS